MQEAFSPYPGDEFMWVLEGRVAMVDGEGHETLVQPGQTFCLRNAIPISWKQVGFLRKFYMTYANPSAPFEIHGEVPVQRDNTCFTNDAGNMFVGMWDSEAFESEMKLFPCYEFVQLLEDEVKTTEEDGTPHPFKARDAFFVPKGTVCSWSTSGYIKKYYPILDPGSG